MIQDETLVVATEHQISSDVAGEAVILDLEAGEYYGLNTVGARVWKIIQTPTSVATIRSTLLDEFDVSYDRCDRELKELLSDLKAHGLIRFETAHSA